MIFYKRSFMPRYNFDQQFFKYFQQLDRKLLARSLNLGGSPYGGGSPPGGFIGYLPQDRVSYDTVELESNATPASGISLVDNLNHIRYRLGAIEGTVVGSGGGVNIYEDDVLVASDVTLINFEGGVTVIDEGSNKATINITGSALDEKVKISANDTTANYLFPKLTEGTNITITEVDDGGNETIEIAYTGIATDEKVKISDNDTTIGYLDGKIIAGTYVTLVQVNDGGDEQLQINCTASGISGPDELIKISSNDTTAEYLETKITSGDGIILSVLYEGINEQIEINSKGLVVVSSGDTTLDYLAEKIHGGTGIGVYIVDGGGDESIEIDFQGIVIEQDDFLISDVILTLNFEGDVVVTDNGGGRATVNVTTSGIGGDMDMIAIQVFC
jgi:hypothetical protein